MAGVHPLRTRISGRCFDRADSFQAVDTPQRRRIDEMSTTLRLCSSQEGDAIQRQLRMALEAIVRNVKVVWIGSEVVQGSKRSGKKSYVNGYILLEHKRAMSEIRGRTTRDPIVVNIRRR